MEIKRDEGLQEEGSLKARARRSIRIRKKQLRTKIVLFNAAIAMLAIMSIFVLKLISLNQSDQTKSTKEARVEKSVQAKKDEKGSDAAKSTKEPSVTPAAVVEQSGKDRWIRKDLDKSKPMVALTFDDGPYTPVTKKILSTAKKYDAKVTFFVVGNRVPNFSESVKQAYEQGCQIASHTYEHKVLTGLNAKGIKEQIEKANRAISKVIGCPATALRPPGGGVNDKVRKYVGLPMVCWDVDTEDWKSRNAEKVLKRCHHIDDGDVVLMHDLYPSTAQAVQKLIPYLKKKGFQLVTVDELFYYKGIKLQNGKVYYNAK